MSFDVNLPAINHLEVAPDKNRLTRIFLTNYCKALSDAFNENINVHKMKIIAFESTGRLKQYITRFLSKKQGIISFEKKYPVVIKHRELATSQPLFLYSHRKCR